MWIFIFGLIGTICSLFAAVMVIRILGSSMRFQNDIVGWGPMIGFFLVFTGGILLSFILGIVKQLMAARSKGESPLKSVVFGLIGTVFILSIMSVFFLPDVPMFNPFMLLIEPILKLAHEWKLTGFSR